MQDRILEWGSLRHHICHINRGLGTEFYLIPSVLSRRSLDVNSKTEMLKQIVGFSRAQLLMNGCFENLATEIPWEPKPSLFPIVYSWFLFGVYFLLVLLWCAMISSSHNPTLQVMSRFKSVKFNVCHTLIFFLKINVCPKIWLPFFFSTLFSPNSTSIGWNNRIISFCKSFSKLFLFGCLSTVRDQWPFPSCQHCEQQVAFKY